MLDHLRRAILRYNMLSPGDRLAVAVSGGADSVALLAAFRELAPELGLTLSVAHVNHGLRGAESDADQAFVEQLAAQAGLAMHLCRGEPVGAGENVEQAARRARLAFFAGLVESGQVRRVATAHTEDDQAETLLLRLLRGAGAAGLAGILPVTREGLIRPALQIARADLRQWAAAQGLAWRDDGSNADPAFARNRLRATLLPLLEREWNPAVKPLLAQTAELARQDAAFLDEESRRQAERLLAPLAGGAWVLEAPALLALAPALQGRVVRQAVARVRGDLHQIGFEHVAAVLALAGGPEGDGRVQIPGVDILRSFAWLRFATWPTPETSVRNWGFSLEPGREMVLPGEACRLSVEMEARSGAYNETTVEGLEDRLDVSAIALEELEVRNWRPGDHFQVEPASTSERVKLLFQQNRIPLWERRNWPMIAKKEEIVWMLGMGVAAGRAAGPDSRAVLSIRAIAAQPSAVNMRNRLNLKQSGGRLLS